MLTWRPSTALAALALLGAAAASCRRAQTETDLGATARPESPPPSDATSAVARACRLLQRTPAERRAACCKSPSPSHFEAECAAALTEAVMAGRLAIDEDRLGACSEASELASSGCDWVTPSQPVPPAACREVTQPRVNEAGSCRSSLECVAPLHCEGNTLTTPGRCTAALPNGAACRVPIDVLGSYLFAVDLSRTRPACAGACSLASHRCEDPQPHTCNTDRECPRGQRCTEQHCLASLPSAQQQPGESCQTDFDCRLGGCSGTPARCGMKCAVSLADRLRVTAAPMTLPRRSPEPH